MHAFVALIEEYDRTGRWHGDGFRSLAHWLCLETGFDLPAANELVRVAQALRVLPQINAEFASGALSLDKVRALTRVAVPADQEMWLNVARHAHGAQLTRICRAFAQANGEASDTHDNRGISWSWRDDGMLYLTALLSPEDGSVVIRAIEKAMKPPRRELVDARARRADALIDICTSGAHQPARVVLHIEADHASVEDGPAVPHSVARFLSCDSQVARLTERDGTPLDVGRARRLVTGRLRHAMQTRDRSCRFPGCGVPARHTHAHHIEHWMDGGRTDLGNVISLCGFHHRGLHNGAYRITREPVGLTFRTRGGWEIEASPPKARDDASTPTATQSPRALDSGPIRDFGYVISVLSDGSDFHKRHHQPD
jgi:hypothetical protein